MERTDAVRSVQEVLFFSLSDDVNRTTQCIRAQRGRYYTFIDFHPVDQVDGQVCERHTAPFAIQRHTVDEVAHGITGQPVDREVEIRTYAPLFAHFDASRAIDQFIQVMKRINDRFHIERIDRKRTLPCLLRLCLPIHFHGIQVYSAFFQLEIESFVAVKVE